MEIATGGPCKGVSDAANHGPRQTAGSHVPARSEVSGAVAAGAGRVLAEHPGQATQTSAPRGPDGGDLHRGGPHRAAGQRRRSHAESRPRRSNHPMGRSAGRITDPRGTRDLSGQGGRLSCHPHPFDREVCEMLGNSFPNRRAGGFIPPGQARRLAGEAAPWHETGQSDNFAVTLSRRPCVNASFPPVGGRPVPAVFSLLCRPSQAREAFLRRPARRLRGRPVSARRREAANRPVNR